MGTYCRSSRGIGRLSALFMAEQRCNLILHSRSLDGTKLLLEEVKKKGIEAYSVVAELSNTDEVDKMLQEIDANLLSFPPWYDRKRIWKNCKYDQWYCA